MTTQKPKRAVGRCGKCSKACLIKAERDPGRDHCWVDRRGKDAVAVNIAYTPYPAVAVVMAIAQCRKTPHMLPEILEEVA